MVKVTPVPEHCYYMDGYLKANLDYVKNDVKRKDFDSFIVVDGREGYGKSTMACQIALYLDPTYNLSRCCFTSDQFEDACENASKYQAVIFDETMGYLSSRGAMSTFNKRLIKIMSEMRSKNLYVILCIPNIFELDRYPAIHRSTGLIHIYQRTRFGCYDYPTKKKLYLTGKKFYSYSVSPNFIGKFYKYFPLNREEYEKKKQESIKLWLDTRVKEKKYLEQKIKLIRWIYENCDMTQEKIGVIVGETGVRIGELLGKQGKEALEKTPIIKYTSSMKEEEKTSPDSPIINSD